MKLITERDSIKSAITSFIRQHGRVSYGADTRNINVGEELSKLDSDIVSAEEVNALIDRDWVSKTCHDCGAKVKTVVQLGEDIDYESCTANVCIDCLKKAINLFEQTEDK